MVGPYDILARAKKVSIIPAVHQVGHGVIYRVNLLYTPRMYRLYILLLLYVFFSRKGRLLLFRYLVPGELL